MKKLLCMCLFFSFICLNVQAQEHIDPLLDRIKERAFNAPNNLNKRALTAYLIKPYNNDYQKLQAIAYWIASHIAYDGYKYNGKENKKEMRYTYDTFKYRTGICEDFAELFVEMAELANIKDVYYVSGYVIENQTRIKRSYNIKDVGKETAHAWNEIFMDNRKFFVDTTFMSSTFIGLEHRRATASFRHKIDLKKRNRQNNVNTNIRDFYFDFTPRKELKQYKKLHVLDKYIKGIN